MVDPAGKIPFLVEAGDYVINVCYMIMRHRIGKPDPRSELDIRLEAGIEVLLRGDDARTFDRQLARLIPLDEPNVGAVGSVQVSTKKRKPPRPPEGG